jgi:hypothetical protein
MLLCFTILIKLEMAREINLLTRLAAKCHPFYEMRAFHEIFNNEYPLKTIPPLCTGQMPSVIGSSFLILKHRQGISQSVCPGIFPDQCPVYP